MARIKRALFVAFAISLPCAAIAAPAPGRKTPGPSAIETARLKNSPPPGYLSHYLPDDRYKIAGGVWKYVTTDLDTYYHVPSSPNMMRQPASGVIGFANAHDAEEAGYVADPTDGTAIRAAPSTNAPRAYLDGSSTEQPYVARITAILQASKRAEDAWTQKMRNNGAGTGTITPEIQRTFLQALPLMRKFAFQVKAVRPPSRYDRFHALLVTEQRQEITAMNALSRSLGQNRGLFALQGTNILGVMETRRALLQEAQQVGIDPALFR